jgi:hypothetical protein
VQQSKATLSRTRLHVCTRAFAILLLVAGGLLLFAVFRLNPAEHSFFPRCFFHSWTGLECPGCGGQRAVHHLLHGHIATAFRCNALFVSLLPVAAWYLIRFVLQRSTERRLPSPFHHHVWPWVLAGFVIAFGIVRNLPGCDWLRP